MTYIIDQIAIDNAAPWGLANKAVVEIFTEMEEGYTDFIAGQMIKTAQYNLPDMITDNEGNWNGMENCSAENIHKLAVDLTSDLFDAWKMEVTKKITALMTKQA